MNSSQNTYDQHFPDKDPRPTLLIVDDEESSRKRLKGVLNSSEEGRTLRTVFVSSLPEALEILSTTPVHVILLDKNLGPDSSVKEHNGIEAIPDFLQIQPHAQILVVTGSNDSQDTVRAMRLGALDYVTKETPDSLLMTHIHRAITVSKISITQVCRERSGLPESTELGGKSKIFRAVLAQTQILAESNRPVFF